MPQPVPFRTDMHDASGKLTRTWLLYFQSLGGARTVNTVGNANNIFTPDLSQGGLQYVLLVADSTLNAPLNEDPAAAWTLIVDQDATGGHNLIFDPTYFYTANLLGKAAASTRAQSQWIADANGYNSLSGTPSTDQPIPPTTPI